MNNNKFRFGLPELGKIKIGKKIADEYRQLDHFLITTLERDAKGELLEDYALMQNLGEKPNKLDIVLPFDGIDSNFFVYRALYRDEKCICASTHNNKSEEKVGYYDIFSGYEKDYFEKIKDSEETEDDKFKIKCPCKFAETEICKELGILSCILGIKKENIGAVYKFRTAAKHSISQIITNLTHLSNITDGWLAYIPLKLVLQPKSIKINSKYKKIHIVHINFDGKPLELKRAVQARLKQEREISGKEPKRIIMPTIEIKDIFMQAPEEQKDISEEFYAGNIQEKTEKIGPEEDFLKSALEE